MEVERAARRPAAPSLLDVAVAVVLGVLVTAGTLFAEGAPDERSVDGLAVALGLCGAGSVLLRRAWPAATLAVAGGAVAAYDLLDYPGGPIYLTIPVAVLAASVSTDRVRAYAGAAVLVAGVTVADWVADGDLGLHELVLAGWVAAAVFAADALRARAERAAAAEARARDEADRALAEERLRIARDLHDSVAHSMATINVQAGAAARLLDRDPAIARDALEAIRVASGEVLDELGVILGLLRRGEAAPRLSTPGIDDVSGLVEWARTNGLAVHADVTPGLGSAVRPAVRDAAYRVAQEGLTNVVRHAPEATARLTVSLEPSGALLVSVVDDGGGEVVAASPGGLGLVGMRERVDATGGRLEAGPRPTGGFEVVATWASP